MGTQDGRREPQDGPEMTPKPAPDAPDLPAAYAWEAFGADFRRAVLSATAQYGRAPDACVTHSFAGDCALMELAERLGMTQQEAQLAEARYQRRERPRHSPGPRNRA